MDSGLGGRVRPLGIRVNAISPEVILPPDWDPDTEYPARFSTSTGAG
jgi:hypothetical protein